MGEPGQAMAATFPPDLAGLTISAISVCPGEKIPRKGGPGLTRSDPPVANRSDPAPHAGAKLEVMEGGAWPRSTPSLAPSAPVNGPPPSGVD